MYRTRVSIKTNPLSLSKDYPVTKHNMSAKHWNINSDYKKTKNVSEDKIYPVNSKTDSSEIRKYLLSFIIV